MENFPYFVRNLHPSLYVNQINQQTRFYMNFRKSMQSNEDKKNMLYEIEKLKSELQEIKESIATLKQAEILTHVGKPAHNPSLDQLKQVNQDFSLSIEEYIYNQENGLNQIQFQLQQRTPTCYTNSEESKDYQKESSKLLDSLFDEDDFNSIEGGASSSLESILNQDDFLDIDSPSSKETIVREHPLSKFPREENRELKADDSGSIKENTKMDENQNHEITIDTVASPKGPADSIEKGDSEDGNYGLVSLFDSLPSGYPIKSILTNGTEFYVSSFINFEPEHQLVYFTGNENIITIECNEIDGIILGNDVNYESSD